MGDGRVGGMVADTAPLSLDELLARAESAVANLQDAFEASVDQRVHRVAELLRAGGLAMGAHDAASKELRRLSHDIKGEAGTFGYDLLGEIAGLLSDYLRSTPTAKVQLQTLSCFAGALESTWAQRLRGDGGLVGARVLESLRLMTGPEARA